MNFREATASTPVVDSLQPRGPEAWLGVRDAQGHERVARIKLGLQDSITLAISNRRVTGLRRRLRRGDVDDAPAGCSDDYVIATGETHSIETCSSPRSSARHRRLERYVQQDQRFYRPAEVDC